MSLHVIAYSGLSVLGEAMSTPDIGEVAVSMKHGSDTNRCSEENNAETNAEDSGRESRGSASLRGFQSSGSGRAWKSQD